MSTPWNSRSSEPSGREPEDATTTSGTPTDAPTDAWTDRGTRAGTDATADKADTSATRHTTAFDPFAAGGAQGGPYTPAGGTPSGGGQYGGGQYGGGQYGQGPHGAGPYASGPYTPAGGSPYPPPAGTPAGGWPQPGYGAYPAYPAAPPTSGLAIASLVCGIVGLFLAGLTSIPAVICGHLAWPRTRPGQEAGHGLTVAGLILGYIPILGWILFWGFFIVVAAGSTR